MNIEKIKNENENSSAQSKGKNIISKDKRSKSKSKYNIKRINTNNIKTKKIWKPCLKSSKINIDKKKNKINKIFEDNLTLKKILFIQEKNDIFLNNSLIKGQTSYEIEMDNLYKEKFEKLKNINEKYDDEIFELENEVEEDEKAKEENDTININNNNINNNNDCSVKIVFNRLIEDKNKQIEKLNKEYEYKSNIIYNKYMNNFDFDDLEGRNMIYRNQIYENIRFKINDAINTINNKSVHFKLDSEINNNSKNTSSTEITA